MRVNQDALTLADGHPTARINNWGLIDDAAGTAQLVEQRNHNPKASGSNPDTGIHHIQDDSLKSRIKKPTPTEKEE